MYPNIISIHQSSNQSRIPRSLASLPITAIEVLLELLAFELLLLFSCSGSVLATLEVLGLDFPVEGGVFTV